jgi:hypothetical protein
MPPFNMARQKLPPHKHSRAAGISLPPELIRAARKVSSAQGMSLSMFVRQLLMKQLGEAK